MTLHDTYGYFKENSPYEPVVHLFDNGFPLRDPFPMARATDPSTGERILGWVPDMERMSDEQKSAIANLISSKYPDFSAEDILREGFMVQSEWIERIEVGAEGYWRSVEWHSFLDSDPATEEFLGFFQAQFEIWIQGDTQPPPLPSHWREVPPELLNLRAIAWFNHRGIPLGQMTRETVNPDGTITTEDGELTWSGQGKSLLEMMLPSLYSNDDDDEDF